MKRANRRRTSCIAVAVILLVPAIALSAFIKDTPKKPAKQFPKGAPVEMPVQAPSGIVPESLLPWENLGPGGGGCMYWPSYAPTDPNTVIVSCDMAGNYLSVDGGRTWTLFKNLGRSAQFAFHPKNPNIILAAEASAVQRSTDGGKTWTPTASQVTRQSPDCCGHAVLFDPDFPDMAWCSIGMWQLLDKKGIYGIEYSTNSGVTFKRASGMDGVFAWMIAVDPATPQNARRLIAATENGIYQSHDGGKSWKKNTAWKFGKSYGCAVLSPLSRDRAVYLATSRTQLYKSLDRGESWLAVGNVTKPGGYPMEVTCSPYQDKIAYATAPKGVWVTRNGGNTWELTGTSLQRLGWRESYKDNTKWANHVNAGVGGLGVAAGAPKTCMGVSDGTADVTHDAGGTWDAVYSFSEDGNKTFTGYGLAVTNAYEARFKPGDPNVLFLCYTDIGGYRSENYGKSFQITMDGAPRFYGSGYRIFLWNTVYAIRFDPDNPNTCWMAHSAKHNLPLANTDDYYRGYVSISTNGGKNWSQSSEGLPVTPITDLRINPDSPAGKRQLFAALFPGGVYRSDDNGRKWAAMNAGLPRNARVYRIALGPRERVGGRKSGRAFRSLYAVVYCGNGAGLYRSDNYGGNWKRVDVSTRFSQPYDIVVDPEDANRLYVSDASGGRGGGGGFYLSVDRGATWKKIISPGRERGITVSPFDPNVVFFCANMNVYVSTNKGESFTTVPGFPRTARSKRVTVDAADPNAIWVATGNVSFLRGPWKEGVEIQQVRDLPAGSVAVAYANQPKKQVERLNLNLSHGKLPSVDPEKAVELKQRILEIMIEAINDMDAPPAIDVPLFGRLITAKLTGADEDGLELEVDDEVIDLEWGDIDETTFRNLCLLTMPSPTADDFRLIAEFYARTGNRDFFWEEYSRASKLSPEHVVAIKSLLKKDGGEENGDEADSGSDAADGAGE